MSRATMTDPYVDSPPWDEPDHVVEGELVVGEDGF